MTRGGERAAARAIGGSGLWLLGQKHNWRCNANCSLASESGASARTQASSDCVARRRDAARTALAAITGRNGDGVRQVAIGTWANRRSQ